MKNDGGPAFPATFPPELAKALTANFGGNTNCNSGMSLRDYFAAKAMQAIINKLPFLAVEDTTSLRTPIVSEEEGQVIRQAVALLSYEYADAMLTEREKE